MTSKPQGRWTDHFQWDVKRTSVHKNGREEVELVGCQTFFLHHEHQPNTDCKRMKACSCCTNAMHTQPTALSPGTICHISSAFTILSQQNALNTVLTAYSRERVIVSFYNFYHLINGILQVKNKICRIILMDLFVIFGAIKKRALCLDWLYYYSSCNYIYVNLNGRHFILEPVRLKRLFPIENEWLLCNSLKTVH